MNSADRPGSTGNSSCPPRVIVVVVEDDQAIASPVAEILNDEPSYRAVAAGDGRQALEIIRSMHASLVLSDVKLPEMDGFALYDALKADPTTAHIPVIFMPASRFDRESKERSIERPLMKPFDIGIGEFLDRWPKSCPRARAHMGLPDRRGCRYACSRPVAGDFCSLDLQELVPGLH